MQSLADAALGAMLVLGLVFFNSAVLTRTLDLSNVRGCL